MLNLLRPHRHTVKNKLLLCLHNTNNIITITTEKSHQKILSLDDSLNLTAGTVKEEKKSHLIM